MELQDLTQAEQGLIRKIRSGKGSLVVLGDNDPSIYSLEDVVVDIAFIATNGITVERGLTTPDQAEAAVKRAMIRAAPCTVVLADHTKVGRSYFACFGRLHEVDKLITDSGLDEVAARRLQDGGLEVLAA